MLERCNERRAVVTHDTERMEMPMSDAGYRQDGPRKSQGQVEILLNKVEKQVAAMQDRLSSLEMKLDAVLTPPQPERPDGLDVEASPDSSMFSSVALNLYSIENTLIQINDRIHRLHERVDL